MINWDRLTDLRRDIGEEDFVDILGAFFEDMNETMQTLHKTTKAEMVEFHLHALKNSALTLGMVQLSDLCQTTEHLAARGTVDHSALTLIQDRLNASIAALHHQFGVPLPSATIT